MRLSWLMGVLMVCVACGMPFVAGAAGVGGGAVAGSSSADDADNGPDDSLLVGLDQILGQQEAWLGRLVSVRGRFLGWKAAGHRPPVTRSDWQLESEAGETLYCTGPLPTGLEPDDPSHRGRPVSVLGTLRQTARGEPYLVVTRAQPITPPVESMVSVANVLFDPLGMHGRTVGMLGVLTKGYDTRGRRLYLLADPTGAITLERLPRLFPRGTILRIRGVVGRDDVGLPILRQVEIIAHVR